MTPLIALVIPVFNESAVLPELLRRLTQTFAGDATVNWSVVFVDDGSTDETASQLRRHAAEDPRFQLLELSRNFGHQPAITAGMHHAAKLDPAAVVVLDADLQDPPELIPQLVAEWRDGAEVVEARRRSRRERGLRRLGFDVFHAILGRLSDFPVSGNTGTFSLLARPALDAYLRLQERHRFFPGLRSWIGFKTSIVLYDRQERASGNPVQTYRRLFSYAMDAILSFSYLPLRALAVLGTLVCLSGIALGAYFGLKRILGVETAFTGFTTLVILVLILGGAQLLGIGVLGLYLGRIYDEVKRRPLFVVRETPAAVRE